MIDLHLCHDGQVIDSIEADVPDVSALPALVLYAGQLFVRTPGSAAPDGTPAGPAYELQPVFDGDQGNFPPRLFTPEEVAIALAQAKTPTLEPVLEAQEFGVALTTAMKSRGGTSAGLAEVLTLQPFMVRAWLTGAFIPVGSQFGQIIAALPSPLPLEDQLRLEGLRIRALEAIAMQGGRVLRD